MSASTATDDRTGRGAESRQRQTSLELYTPLVLAVIAYVPLLLTHRGMVGADTKNYLYLDPSRLLANAPYLWDPNVGMGTVTHQNIGYLLPMGPWYWTFHALHVPVWIAQRLWLGTLLFAAGTGVIFLLRTLGWRYRTDAGEQPSWDLHGPAVLVASLAFMLTPYTLEYEARISAILMPWAALPWMVALVARGLRSRSWRHPALFALVVALVGGVNATSLMFAGIAPVLWFPFAVWATREVSLRQAAVVLIRTAALTIGASLWWMAGLLSQAGYGLDVLRYSETVPVVAQTGLPMEILRGLGNWYFYGRDVVGPWVQPASEYTQHLWQLSVSYALPLLAFIAAALTRWRYKLYFLALVVIGLAVAVGVHPYSHPSPLGVLFKAFADSSSAGLALRNVGRAVPLVALGTAVLLGAGVETIASRLGPGRITLTRTAAGVLVVLIIANMTPLFAGQFVDNNLQRPNDIPTYWTKAAEYLNGRGQGTRVLELPGGDFSHYRWGTTLDPVTPGLMDRPFVSRELIPYGSPASADLIRALDRRLQEGIFEPQSLAALARLISAGDLVLRSDLQYERFNTPRPKPTWLLFGGAARPPAGLRPPVPFGPPVPTRSVIPLFDETSLATPATAPDPPAVAVYDVNNALPMVRTEQLATPVIVAGDGEGLVDLAATGLLNGRPEGAAPILYSAALSAQPSAMSDALAAGADLVLTDTNRKRGQRWGTTQYNNGYTETAGETPLTSDPTDNRLPVFPGATDNSYTVAQQRGVAGVRATAFGDPVAYAPGERPDLALDGDPTTAWKAGAFTDVKGDRLRIDLSAPVTTNHINLVQTLVQARERYITQATVTFDGGHPLKVDLNQESRTVAGQDVHFPQRTFKRVDITVNAMNFGQRADYRGGSPVGFAEVRIPGVQVDEVIRPPVDLLQAAGPGSISHRLVVVLTRMRSNALASYTTDEEQNIVRTFSLPAGRTFSFSGTARLSAAGAADAVPPPGNDPLGPELVDTPKMDDLIDSNLGLAPPSAGGTTAQSSERLPGDLNARAAAAIDGDPTTAWTTAFGDQSGKWIQATALAPATMDHLDLQLVADGRHSVPTQLRVTASSANAPAQSVDVAVPTVADLAQPGRTVPVRIALPHPLSGTTVRVTVLSVREERTINYLSAIPQTEPIAIAELGIPGFTQSRAAGAMPTTCRNDLLRVDGRPVGLRISGSRADALARQPLTVSLCGPPLVLAPGDHLIRAVPGAKSGIDLDRLVFGSDRGGAALDLATTTLGAATPTRPTPPTTPAAPTPTTAPAPTAAPAVRIVHQGRTSMTLSIDHAVAGQPFWLVLGHSHNNGWRASVSGAGSLGRPALVDGYANGWLVRPGRSGPLTVHLDWTPQRKVWIALGLSALAVLVCFALAFTGAGRGSPVDSSGAPFDPAERFTTLPALPALTSPLRPTGRTLEPSTRLVTALVGTILGMLVIGPIAGLIMGAVLALAVSLPRGRALLTVGSVVLLAASALYVIELQWRYHFPPKIEWPEHFHRITLVPWVAAAWLIADAAIEHLRSRRRRTPIDP